MFRKPFTIGIAGGSGAGKTYFIEQIVSRFSAGEVCAIQMDQYYKGSSRLQPNNSDLVNYDLPNAIDHHTFLTHLKLLKEGKGVAHKEYTFGNSNVPPRTIEYTPGPVIFAEGLFIQYFAEIASEIDLMLYLKTPRKIRLERRLARDQELRGYDADEITRRFREHAEPIFKETLEPLGRHANLIIPNSGNPMPARETIVGIIKSVLAA